MPDPINNQLQDLEEQNPIPDPDESVVKDDVDEPKVIEPKANDIDSSGNPVDDNEDVVRKLQEEAGIRTPAEPVEGEVIPDAFTEACVKTGWSAEEITEFANGLDDETLISLIPEILDSGVVDSKPEDKPEDKQEAEGQTPKVDDKKSSDDSTTKAELDAVKKELAEIKEGLKTQTEKKQTDDNLRVIQTIEDTFDEAAEEFKIFGKTEELLRYPAGPKKGQIVTSSKEMLAREEVWQKAQPFVQAGIPVKDAMEIGLTWYKGKYLAKDIERNLIKGLKKHETKLSAKRSGKRTVKQYEDEDERKADVVREAARKAGIKGEFGT